MNQNELLQWGALKLKDAQDLNLYGSVTIRFENGKIIGSKIEQSDKPLDLKNKNR